jgi:hypothetical protein
MGCKSLQHLCKFLDVLNVPLIHSSHRVTCYVCQPEMRDVPTKGKCRVPHRSLLCLRYRNLRMISLEQVAWELSLRFCRWRVARPSFLHLPYHN